MYTHKDKSNIAITSLNQLKTNLAEKHTIDERRCLYSIFDKWIALLEAIYPCRGQLSSPLETKAIKLAEYGQTFCNFLDKTQLLLDLSKKASFLDSTSEEVLENRIFSLFNILQNLDEEQINIFQSIDNPIFTLLLQKDILLGKQDDGISLFERLINKEAGYVLTYLHNELKGKIPPFELSERNLEDFINLFKHAEGLNDFLSHISTEEDVGKFLRVFFRSDLVIKLITQHNLSFQDLIGYSLETLDSLLLKNDDLEHSLTLKNLTIFSLWHMEEINFKSYIQWLPKEIVQDIAVLLKSDQNPSY